MLKKLLAAYTVTSFALSFIVAPAAEGVREHPRYARSATQIQAALDAQGSCSLVIPPVLGRITGSFSPVPLPGSPSTMELPDAVIIQDLHCHPEAQRKIAGIIDAVSDAAGGVSGVRVFIEGASGQMDTSWIMAIEDAPLRERVRDALMDTGRLTGAEYWAMRQPSARAGRSADDAAVPASLLCGLEDKGLHRENIVRLAGLMARTEQNERILQGMARDVAYLRTAYLSPRNRRFHRILERYAAGDITTVRYYTLLREYVRNINEHPERYGSVLPVRWHAYPAIETYLRAHAMEKRLRYKRAVAQMGTLIGVLKETLPYSVYEDLRRRTDNFGRMEVVCPAVGNLFEEYQLEKAGDFSELKLLFACQAMQQSVNPLQLLWEERRLVEALRVALADDVAEAEVAFLADFFAFFARYIRHAQTPDEYEYFRARFEKFGFLWGTYFIHNDILGLADEIGVLDTYFAVNERRTAVFLESLAAAQRLGPGRGRIVNVLVTGGFHAEGLARGLEERQSSYIVITPNITMETTAAGRVYGQIINEQARLFESQALAALPSSAEAQVVSIQHDRVVISINKKKFTFTIRDGKFLEPSVRAQTSARSPAGMAEAVRRSVNLCMRHPQLGPLLGQQNPLIGTIGVVVAVSRIAMEEGADEGWWEPGGPIWELISDGMAERIQASDTDLTLDKLQRFPAWWQKNIVSQADLRAELHKEKPDPFLIALHTVLNEKLHLLLPSEQPSLTFAKTRILLSRIFSHAWLRRHAGLIENAIAPIVEAPVFLLLTITKKLHKKSFEIMTAKVYSSNPNLDRDLIEQGITGVVRCIAIGLAAALVLGLLSSIFLPQGTVMLAVGAVVLPDVFSHIFYSVAFRNERLTSWLIGRTIRQSDRQRSEEIRSLAGEIAALPKGRQIVFLTGPSASGKTTTTKEIIAAAEQQGRRVVRLSLDEYYRLRNGDEEQGYERIMDEHGSIQKDKDGNELLNYDTPAALNWDLVAADITALMLGYTVNVKRYVRRGKQSERVTASTEQLSENDIVLVEGIFALTDEMKTALQQDRESLRDTILTYAAQCDATFVNRVKNDGDTWYDEVQSIFSQALSAPGDPDYNPEHNHTIFIEPNTPFGDFDDVLRLLRRLHRDSMDAGNIDASIAATIERYDSVVKEAAKFVGPARARKRWGLNTYRAGELYFWTTLLRGKLGEAHTQAERDADTEAAEKIKSLLDTLADVSGVSPMTMRAWYKHISHSVLREFAGETYPAPRPVGYWVSSRAETAGVAVPAGYAPVRIRPMPSAAHTRPGKFHLKNLKISGNRVWLNEEEGVPTLYVSPGSGTFEDAVNDILTAIHGRGVLQGNKRPLRMLSNYFKKQGIALDATKVIVFWDEHDGDGAALGEIPVYSADDARSFGAQALLDAHAAEMTARRHEIGFLIGEPGVFLDGNLAETRYDNQLFFVNPDTLGQTRMQDHVMELKHRGAKVILLCETDREVTEALAERMRMFGIDHVVIKFGDPVQLNERIGADIVVEGGDAASGSARRVRPFFDSDAGTGVPLSSVPLIVNVTLPTEEATREKMIQDLNALPVGTVLIFDANRMLETTDSGMDLTRYGVNMFARFRGTVNKESQELYQSKVARRLAPLTFATDTNDADLNKELQELIDMIRGTARSLNNQHPNAAYAEAARVHLTKTSGAARDAFMHAAERYLRMRYFLARQGKLLGMADQAAEDLMEQCFNVAGVDVTVLMPTLTQNSVVDAFRNTHKDEPIEVYVRAFKREILGQARQRITLHNDHANPQALRDALELLSLLDGKIVLPTTRPGDVNLQAIYTILSAA